MKKLTILAIFILSLLCYLSPVFAEKQDKQEVAEGMEIVKPGGVNILVPKGAKVTKKDGLIEVESTTEYVVRNLGKIQQRLENIEAEARENRQKIEKLQQALDDMHGQNYMVTH